MLCVKLIYDRLRNIYKGCLIARFIKKLTDKTSADIAGSVHYCFQNKHSLSV